MGPEFFPFFMFWNFLTLTQNNFRKLFFNFTFLRKLVNYFLFLSTPDLPFSHSFFLACSYCCLMLCFVMKIQSGETIIWFPTCTHKNLDKLFVFLWCLIPSGFFLKILCLIFFYGLIHLKFLLIEVSTLKNKYAISWTLKSFNAKYRTLAEEINLDWIKHSKWKGFFFWRI